VALKLWNAFSSLLFHAGKSFRRVSSALTFCTFLNAVAALSSSVLSWGSSAVLFSPTLIIASSANIHAWCVLPRALPHFTANCMMWGGSLVSNTRLPRYVLVRKSLSPARAIAVGWQTGGLPFSL